MRRGGDQSKGWNVRTTDILMDIREAVLSRGYQSGVEHTCKLRQYYDRIGDGRHVVHLADENKQVNISGARAVERLQDAVRQLVEVRKNSKASAQIKACKESLREALHDTLRFGGKAVFGEQGVEQAAESIDQAILASITQRTLERIEKQASFGRG